MLANRNQKNLSTLIAILVAVFTTGYLRIYWIPFLPETDGGLYTAFSQYFFSTLSNGELIDSGYPVALYSLITSWVYGLEVNQFIALRWIDLCLAITASILFFKVIENESGSIFFSTVVVSTVLIVMNNYSFILFGFRNSIWAAYVPLFLALLISQSINNKNHFLFYMIGAAAAFGVLLREPFLFFYLTGLIAIFFAYGWKPFSKFLIGSAILGFTTLYILIMLRGEGGLQTIIDAYIGQSGAIRDLAEELLISNFFKHSIIAIKAYWFGIILSIISAMYIFKLNSKDRKLVSINRFFFWLALALVPIIEPISKLGFDYHFINCLPGLAGISALCWKYVSLNESKIVKNYVMGVILMLFVFGAYPNLSRTLNINVYNKESPVSHAYNSLLKNNYTEIETIRLSNYLIAADMIKQLSNKDSTLALAGFAEVLYPLTGLLPASFETMNLRTAYLNLNWNEDKLVDLLKKVKPTIIFPTKQELPRMQDLTQAIARTNLYERVAIVSYSPDVYYKSIYGDIYRLKSFRERR
ncbi:hypothetical protein OAI28_05825 [Methylophilaceae bacterium]|nr:hypothetical protein [Methylophilaceae bacterium]